MIRMGTLAIVEGVTLRLNFLMMLSSTMSSVAWKDFRIEGIMPGPMRKGATIVGKGIQGILVMRV